MMTNESHYPAQEVGHGFGHGGIEVVVRRGKLVVALKCDGYDVAYLNETFLQSALDELASVSSQAGLRSVSI